MDIPLLNAAATAAPSAVFDDAVLASLVEQMADEFRQQGQVDIASWQSRYPQFASELVRLVPTLSLLADISSAAHEAAANEPHPSIAGEKTLGDFRIVREVGRGGMGIVYEAEQLSLNRRVALKTLPTAAVLDPRTLQRFKNEAQAAAALDHPHIVDVYGVGVERGVHYYAMRLIDGCTLADVVAELRGVAGKEDESKVEGRRSKVEGDKSKIELQAETRPIAGLSTFSTLESLRSQRFFRAVAELGLHVAEALEHAHGQGVVHRDIKPSNLMLDGQGKVWVTDFGLARIESNPSLTMTGDLLGTLRYMSPEQALASRVPIDHRADIYSLGATLYELLALEPVFGDQERAALLQRIAFAEPVAPRKLNPRIPADLETILLKMLEKDPASRYATARDLADDFSRFARDLPIQARRRSFGQQMAKWAARNRSMVATAGTIALVAVAVIGGLLGWQARDAAARRAVAESVASGALRSASGLAENRDWPRVITELKQAAAAVGGEALVRESLRDEITARRHEAEFAWRLENIRLLAASTVHGDFDFATTDQAYEEAIRDYGIELTADGRNATVAKVRRSAIAGEIAAALTNWSIVRRRLGGHQQPSARQLMVLAKDIDGDAWRNRLRDTFMPAGISNEELSALIERAPTEMFSATTSFLVIQATASQRVEAAGVEDALRAAQRQFAGDFWINFALARYFESARVPRLEEAVRFYTAALAVRPGTAAVHSNVGTALHRQGRRMEAIAEYRRAIASEPQFAAAYSNLGFALCEEKHFAEAEAVVRRGLAIRDDWAEPHCNLGLALLGQGKLHAAAGSFQRAVDLKPGFTAAIAGLDRCVRREAEGAEAAEGACR